jgi:hypothetical protein
VSKPAEPTPEQAAQMERMAREVGRDLTQEDLRAIRLKNEAIMRSLYRRGS